MIDYWQICNYNFDMTNVRFSWDDRKNEANRRKHDGISFEIAARIFQDPLRLTRQDRHEDGEERWQTIGVVYGVTILLVAHTITEEDENGEAVEHIRLISARRATRKERKRYENENN